MILFGRCSCGCVFESAFDGAAFVLGCMQTCPRCGADAPVDNSFGNFVSSAVEELKSADVYQLDEFRKILKRAAAGEITIGEASAETERLGAGLAALMQRIDPQWASLVLGMVALTLTVAIWCADNLDDEAALQKMEISTQATIALQYKIDANTEISRENLKTNQYILEELRMARIERARQRAEAEQRTGKGVIDFAAARAARVPRK